MKGKIKILFFLSAAMLMLLFAYQTVFASEKDRMPDLEENTKGSLTVFLSYQNGNDDKVPIEGETLQVIKVAEVRVKGGSVSYPLVPAFSESGIVIEGMDATSSNQAAIFLKGIVESKGLALFAGISDKNGKVIFDGLEPGMYLVMQSSGENNLSFYTEMEPYLVSVPLADTSTDEHVWNYQVETLPKTEIKQKPTDGSIVVKKQLTIQQDGKFLEMYAEDSIFYFGLFKDENGTIPVSEDYKKELHIVRGTSGEVVYTGLPEGTYYVYEMDRNGNVVKNGERFETDVSGFTCLVEGDGSQKVILKPEEGISQAIITFNNTVDILPSAYYLEAEINITKRVLKGNQETQTEDTFYAGVFQNENGNYLLKHLVELKQNDTVSVKVDVEKEDGKDYMEYWIFETDKNGNRIDKETFSYDVSGEGSVRLSLGHLTGNIEIKNKVKEDSAQSDTGIDSSGPSGSPVKTGDTTPIALFLVLCFGAAIVLILGRRLL